MIETYDYVPANCILKISPLDLRIISYVFKYLTFKNVYVGRNKVSNQ